MQKYENVYCPCCKEVMSIKEIYDLTPNLLKKDNKFFPSCFYQLNKFMLVKMSSRLDSYNLLFLHNTHTA